VVEGGLVVIVVYDAKTGCLYHPELGANRAITPT